MGISGLIVCPNVLTLRDTSCRQSAIVRVDEELLREVQVSGDTAPFASLVERYRRRVINLARRMLGASFTLDDAEDVAQDAFVELYRQAPRYRYPEPVRPWLYKIAVNKCFDRLRMLQRRPMPGRLHDDDVAVDGPLSSIEADERECRINNAIDGLPPKLKAVFVLRFVDDLAYDEIAKVLKVPIGTVKTWLFRARAALRVQLQEARDNDL